VLTLAALKGLFTPVVSEPVTFVNAPLLAAERGFEVTETKSSLSRDWVDLITLSGEGSRGQVGVAGTTVGQRDAERLVAINGIPIDMAPADHMAFLFYEDRPGVIGRAAQAGRRGPDGADRGRRHPRRGPGAGGDGDRRARQHVHPPPPDGSGHMSRTISGVPRLPILRCRGAASCRSPHGEPRRRGGDGS
jgi:D-3-phosphoglycerate dehydrogenase intervening domain